MTTWKYGLHDFHLKGWYVGYMALIRCSSFPLDVQFDQLVFRFHVFFPKQGKKTNQFLRKAWLYGI